jgi:hypothetical protein
LNEANPFTIGYEIDNPGMKEFQNFLFNTSLMLLLSRH